jgi:alpha-L-arabinofuranosidase
MRATAAIMRLNFPGTSKMSSRADVFKFTSGDVLDENSIAKPKKIAPRAADLTLEDLQFDYTFPANSLTVIRVKTR